MATKRTRAIKAEEAVQNLQKEVVDELTTFKKIGGGALRFENRIIKPGQLFKARLQDIPKVFLNTLEIVTEKMGAVVVDTKRKEPKKEVFIKTEYVIEPIDEEETSFNIVHEITK